MAKVPWVDIEGCLVSKPKRKGKVSRIASKAEIKKEEKRLGRELTWEELVELDNKHLDENSDG